MWDCENMWEAIPEVFEKKKIWLHVNAVLSNFPNLETCKN